MRGGDVRTDSLFSYVSCEARVPQDHPLRVIRAIVEAALDALSPAFAELYAPIGRPSIPPEKLLAALLLQAFCSARSERQLMEQLDDNLLFRWFVGLGVDDPVWDATVFTKNRERLLEGDVAARFFPAEDPPPRHRLGRLDVHAHRGPRQPRTPAQAVGGAMIVPILGTADPQTATTAAGNHHVAPGHPSFDASPSGNGVPDHLISAACYDEPMLAAACARSRRCGHHGIAIVVWRR